MRAVDSFCKVDADRSQAKLRYVETYPEACVAVERPVGWIAGDSIGIRIEQGIGAANMIVEFVDEDGERDAPVECNGLSQLDLSEKRVGCVEDLIVAAHLLIGEREKRARRNHARGIVGRAVDTERPVAQYRKELREIQRRFGEGEVRSDRRLGKRRIEQPFDPVSGIERIVERDRLQTEAALD